MFIRSRTIKTIHTPDNSVKVPVVISTNIKRGWEGDNVIGGNL